MGDISILVYYVISNKMEHFCYLLRLVCLIHTPEAQGLQDPLGKGVYINEL